MKFRTFPEEKFYKTLVFVLLCSGGYFLTSHIQLFPDIPISFSWLDKSIPFWPPMIVVYSSYYIIFWLALLVCEKEIFYTMWKSYLWALGISIAIFVFFPTKIVWDDSSYSGIFVEIYRLIKKLDTPYNAFPSLHVSLALLGALNYLWYQKYRKGLIFLGWGLCIAGSTLIVKQHYVVDVVGGCVVALLALFLSLFLDKIRSKKALESKVE